MRQITIRRPYDAHRHMRQDSELYFTLAHLGPVQKALCMPNTKPPIWRACDVKQYRHNMSRVAAELNSPGWSKLVFDALIAVKLLDATTPQIVRECYEAGAAAVKVYFRGTTTNSEDGVLIDELCKLFPVFAEMEKINQTNERKFLLLWHGEDPRAQVYRAQEPRFMPTLELVSSLFPDLPMVSEHITTREGAATVERLHGLGRKVAATITAHHLFLTIDDVLRGKMKPDHFCLPTAQDTEDRQAIVSAATSGLPCFFLGTDDAYHPTNRKYDTERNECCGGIIVGEDAILHYAVAFDNARKLDRLENFASVYGPNFYGFAPAEDTITLVEKPYTIGGHGNCRKFRQGETLPWSLE